VARDRSHAAVDQVGDDAIDVLIGLRSFPI
jgi:hypothetical protein